LVRVAGRLGLGKRCDDSDKRRDENKKLRV